MCIYSAGPRCYKLLPKRGYTFPSPSTLRRWASKLSVEPGVQTQILAHMNSYIPVEEKLCILSFDEMKVREVWSHDRKNDLILSPKRIAQVAMARSLRGNWKQPNDYPSPLEFKYRLRSYLLGRNEDILWVDANVESASESLMQINEEVINGSISMENNEVPEEEVTVENEGGETSEELISVSIFKEINEVPLTNEEELEVTEEEAANFIRPLKEVKFNGLENFAGYIIHKMGLTEFGHRTDEGNGEGYTRN